MGVADDGSLKGLLGIDSLDQNLFRLSRMANLVGASIVEKRILLLPSDDNSVVAEVHIAVDAHRVTDSEAYDQTDPPIRDRRVVILGPGGTGKSTLVAVLLGHGRELDDGHGSMRTLVLRHPHELLSGHTSSSSEHPLVPYANSSRDLDTSIITAMSSVPVIFLVDTAAEVKSAVQSITKTPPDALLLVLNDSSSEQEIQEWINLCDQASRQLSIPVLKIFNKSDTKSFDSLAFSKTESAIRTSCVTGKGISEVLTWLSALPTTYEVNGSKVVFAVHDAQWLSDVEAVVVHGKMIGEHSASKNENGLHHIHIGTKLHLFTLLDEDINTLYCRVVVKGIHRLRHEISHALYSGLFYSLAVVADVVPEEKTVEFKNSNGNSPTFFNDSFLKKACNAGALLGARLSSSKFLERISVRVSDVAFKFCLKSQLTVYEEGRKFIIAGPIMESDNNRTMMNDDNFILSTGQILRSWPHSIMAFYISQNEWQFSRLINKLKIVF